VGWIADVIENLTVPIFKVKWWNSGLWSRGKQNGTVVSFQGHFSQFSC